MPVISTHELTPGAYPEFREQIYNALDCCVTFEVNEEIQSLSNTNPEIYNFARALQAPVLEMMLRGFLVDQFERQRAAEDLRAKLTTLESLLTRLANAVWDRPLNPRSQKQLQEFFYGCMNIPEIWTSKRGKKILSMDRETLEKLEVYFHARPIVATILSFRDLAKKLDVLETQIDPDGRMRTALNIGGTETGRFSSSKSPLGTGANFQNIEDKLRRVLVADPGWKICGIDLEQAESREVGWLCGILFNDWTYLDACEGGDLHTSTAKLIWPTLPWPGDPKGDRELAEQPFYRHYSRRDMSKRGGHGCLTAEHEVLTPFGWVPISSKPSVIMTWSKETNHARWGTVSNWIDKPYSGNFVELEGTSLSVNMTADHKVIYFRDRRNPAHDVRAENLPLTGVIPLGANFLGGKTEITPAEARLIAAFQCDGHQKSTNRVEFHFHKQRKFMRLEMLALEANIPFELKPDQNKAFLHAANWPKKAGAYLLDWPRNALEAYIGEHQHWDGNIQPPSVMLSSVDRDHLEWIQTIGRLLGVGGNFQKVYTSGFGSKVYRLQQNNRKYADIASLKTRRTYYAETQVYCPTVPTGYFFVRRNGRISITGNSNYLGSPFTMARHLKVPTKLMEDFQGAYFGAYPGIPQWHRWTAEQLQITQTLVTPFGRTRRFFGRPNDDATLREAVAYVPQSATADRLNLGLFRIWKHMGNRVRLLTQLHDAVYFEYREDDNEAEVIAQALELIDIPLFAPSGRRFSVPGEAKVGWNWGPGSDPRRGWHNPDGLMKFKGHDPRVRTPLLDRIL